MFIVTRSLEVFESDLSARKYRNCIYFWIFLAYGRCVGYRVWQIQGSRSNMRDNFLHCVVMLYIVPKCLLNRYSREVLFVFDLMSFFVRPWWSHLKGTKACVVKLLHKFYERMEICYKEHYTSSICWSRKCCL